MGWLLFESAVAFLILVGIVVWTMAPARKREKPPSDEPERGE